MSGNERSTQTVVGYCLVNNNSRSVLGHITMTLNQYELAANILCEMYVRVYLVNIAHLTTVRWSKCQCLTAGEILHHQSMTHNVRSG